MRTSLTWVLAAVTTLASLPVSLPAPRLWVVQEDRIVLRVHPMNAAIEGPAGEVVLEAGQPDTVGTARLVLAWPGPQDRVRLELRAVPRPPRPPSTNVVVLEAEAELPDGRRIRAERELAFEESFTALFEVCREGGRPLTLAIEAERVHGPALTTRRVVGLPVELLLEIQYASGEHFTTLETNQMSTFVGEPVTYSFRLGELAEAPALQVQLTPRRLFEDLVEVEMEVSGTIPGSDELMVISRREDWMMSRGTTSNLSVVIGEPPQGFRFRVTPRF